MNTRGARVFRWVVMVVLIISMKGNFSEADVCVEKLKELLVSSNLSQVGVELTEFSKDRVILAYFVYSEIKIFDIFFNLYNMGSDKAQEDLRKFLGLDFSTCDHVAMCRAFNAIISDINNRQTDEHFLYASSTYYQSSYSFQTGFYNCTTRFERRIDFNGNPRGIVSKIKEEYETFSRFSPHFDSEPDLDYGTEVFFVDNLRVDPQLFKPGGRIKTRTRFIDLDDDDRDISWVPLTGVVHTATKSKDPETHKCPQDIEITRSELNHGKLHMLYFRPIFTNNTNINSKTECIKNVFSDLRYFVQQATTYKSNYMWQTYNYSAVPDMAFGFRLNLQLILADEMPNLFGPNQITNLYTTPISLPELRTWEYMKVTPPVFYGTTPMPADASTKYISSPFVFALVDRDTGIILKTGAYMRP